MRITGITKKIDRCSGLIMQQVRRAYRRVTPEHKRWVDEEDMVQEAMLAAILCERDHSSFVALSRKVAPQKFSTHLTTALMRTLSR